jgi:hypothetical protein
MGRGGGGHAARGTRCGASVWVLAVGLKVLLVRSPPRPPPFPPGRHVILPKEIAKSVPKGKILTEMEWRSLGVQQSRGWEHYACHRCVRPLRPLGSTPFPPSLPARASLCVCLALPLPLTLCCARVRNKAAASCCTGCTMACPPPPSLVSSAPTFL